MELNELIRTLQKIDLVSKVRSRQKISGNSSSFFKGQGVAFDSIRKYEVGDDVRNINWSVTARFHNTYINTFHEDKVRRIWILIDISGSSIFGTTRRSKLELELEIAATISYNAIKRNNAVGVIFFSDKINRLIKPASGMNNFWHIAKALVDSKPCIGSTQIDIALQFLIQTNNKGSLIFILSDFVNANYQQECRLLAQYNDVLAIRMYDEKEYQLPKLGWVKLEDAENGKQKWVNTSSASFKEKYEMQQKAVQDDFEKTCSKIPINSVAIGTHEDILGKLSFLIH